MSWTGRILAWVQILAFLALDGMLLFCDHPAPPSRDWVELKDVHPGEQFEHNGSVWVRLEPDWTGYEDSDRAMAAGLEAEEPGDTVRVWCACLTDGPWHRKGGLRPIWETCHVRRVTR